ncbi:MAG: G5 domain-containing protein [Lachnospiraceae bacterium]|nr:G5 domain-containing protein [Lachnospiraceae bacterium]
MKTTRLKPLKWIILIAMAGLLLAGLSGCQEKQLNVTIKDQQTETQMSVEEGCSVKQALNLAEIDVHSKDEVTPGLNEKITKENTHISISRYAKVTVNCDETTKEIELTGAKVEDALETMGITLHKNDYMDHDREAYLTDAMSISVIRRSAVTVVADGNKTKCLTKASTVQELLNEQGVSVGKKDRVKPALTKAVKDGTKVVVKRVSVKKITEKEPVDYGTKTEYSSSMYEGTSKVKKQGKKGEKEVVYQVTYVDGKEESRKAVKETVITEPEDQVVVQGTKKKRRIVSRKKVYDCDGSGHGYYIITWSDGTVEYEDF